MQLCSTGYPLSLSCWVRPHVPSSSSFSSSLLCWLWAARLLRLFVLGFGSHRSSSASLCSSLFPLSSPHHCIPCSASFPLSSFWCFCPPPHHFCPYPPHFHPLHLIISAHCFLVISALLFLIGSILLFRFTVCCSHWGGGASGGVGMFQPSASQPRLDTLPAQVEFLGPSIRCPCRGIQDLGRWWTFVLVIAVVCVVVIVRFVIINRRHLSSSFVVIAVVCSGDLC